MKTGFRQLQTPPVVQIKNELYIAKKRASQVAAYNAPNDLSQHPSEGVMTFKLCTKIMIRC